MAAPPQALPPSLHPPAVPDGWRADWSTEYNTWYYVNLSTQISQWHSPLGQSPQPVSPPPAAASPFPQSYPQDPQYPQYPQHQQYAPTQQYPTSDQHSPPPQYGSTPGPQDGPEGERGLGTIVGGGILGIAGGILAGHLLHKKNDNNQKFGFFGNSAGAAAGGSGGGMFQGMASHMPFGNSSPAYSPAPTAAYGAAAGAGAYGATAAAGAGAAGGGMFHGLANHMPFSHNSGPQLHIHCAAYSDQDVTQAVRRLVSPDQSLHIDTTKLITLFGDPWPGNRKQLSVLYSYGERPWELLAGAQDEGMFSIIPHQPIDRGRMEFVQDPRNRVVAVVWGFGNGLGKDKGKGTELKLQEIETTGEFEASNSWMGFDGMCGPAKTAVTYYRLQNGGIAMTSAREGGTVRLPWNPLAKWT